jgi:PAS domain S-box-containing protein
MSEIGGIQEGDRGPERASEDPDSRAISSALLSAVISLMPDAAVVVDAGGQIVSVNAQAEALFGYSRGSLVGLAIEALVPERARTRHRQHRSGYAAAPQNRPMGAGLGLTGRRRDGSEFPLDISLAEIENSGEQLVVAAVRDVSEQRAATAAQAELAAIVRSSLDAIISTTLEGAITNWNPAAEVLLDYPRDQILGQHIAVLVPENASAVLEELLDAAGRTAHRGARDTRWLRRDGHQVDVAVSISPLKDAAGSPLGFSYIVRDISDRKQAEEELLRLLAEEERLERQHSATAEIRLALLSELPLAESLTLVCERASSLVDSPVAVICVKEDGATRIVAATALPSELIGMQLPPGASFAERVIEQAQLIESERRSELSEVPGSEVFPDGPTLGVPVITGGRSSGALIFIRYPGSAAFSLPDRLFAESLAAQAALAFELDRARRDRKEMILVSDRERIGRDLHDHVIQRLFAAAMGLQRSLAFSDTPAARERVAETVDLLDETIREIRNTIFSLSRTAFGEGLLRSQVIEVVQQSEGALGFRPTVRFEGPVDAGVPEALLPDVLAVVREALSNVARHAKASAAELKIVLAGEFAVVEVSDNGIGIVAPTRSSGLANLEERARLRGGAFVVSTLEEGGTRLEWRVPLER